MECVHGLIKVMLVCLMTFSCTYSMSHDKYRKDLFFAVISNNNYKVKGLLKKKPFFFSINEADEKGWSLLGYASSNGNLEIVRLLIESGASPIGGGFYEENVRPLVEAVRNGHLEVVSFLAPRSAKASNILYYLSGGKNPLMIASEAGYLKIAQELLKYLDKPNDINEKDKELGNTALHYALINRHNDLADFLIRSGADISIRKSTGLNS